MPALSSLLSAGGDAAPASSLPPPHALLALQRRDHPETLHVALQVTATPRPERGACAGAGAGARYIEHVKTNASCVHTEVSRRVMLISGLAASPRPLKALWTRPIRMYMVSTPWGTNSVPLHYRHQKRRGNSRPRSSEQGIQVCALYFQHITQNRINS